MIIYNILQLNDYSFRGGVLKLLFIQLIWQVRSGDIAKIAYKQDN